MKTTGKNMITTRTQNLLADALREVAYGAESKIGTFSDALMAEVKKNGWTVISMKNDWKRIFAWNSDKKSDEWRV